MELVHLLPTMTVHFGLSLPSIHWGVDEYITHTSIKECIHHSTTYCKGMTENENISIQLIELKYEQKINNNGSSLEAIKNYNLPQLLAHSVYRACVLAQFQRV